LFEAISAWVLDLLGVIAFLSLKLGAIIEQSFAGPITALQDGPGYLL